VPTELHIVAVHGIPEITPGIDLGPVIAAAAARSGRPIEAGDILVVAQKIVSKAEGALVRLDEVVASAAAEEWASANGKDPRVIEVILRESKRIVRMERGVLIAETRHGFVCANAGVDASNVEPGYVTVLPRDPDASAEGLRVALWNASDSLRSASLSLGSASVSSGSASLSGERPPIAVIVSDTFGRPWREGVVNVALGVAGLRPLLDYRGCRDPHGRELQSTVIAVADELAGAAEMVMRKTARVPVAIVRGAAEWLGEGSAAQLVRDASRDLFR
jgi:coenzyme F420-0:L-glutamate ligase/coenzyme F420-1:gamma-L-glutamate ligase